MVKQKHIVPGRVLGRWAQDPRPEFRNENGDPRDIWIPCMVISFIPHTHRRHNRAHAFVGGWTTLVYWMDDRNEKLESVWIAADHEGWKLLW